MSDFFSLEFVANLLGVVSVAVSSSIFIKMKMDDRKANKIVSIKLILVDGSYEVGLPLPMLRKDISRAEILGRLGMIPINQDKALSTRGFAIKSISTPAFIADIMSVQLSQVDTIKIPCTREEIEQFDIPNS